MVWETTNRLGDPDEANKLLREAAATFEEIGLADTAVECLCDLRNFDEAGQQKELEMKMKMKEDRKTLIVDGYELSVSDIVQNFEGRETMSRKQQKEVEKRRFSLLQLIAGKRSTYLRHDKSRAVQSQALEGVAEQSQATGSCQGSTNRSRAEQSQALEGVAEQSQATSSCQGSTNKRESKKGLSKGRRKG